MKKITEVRRLKVAGFPNYEVTSSGRVYNIKLNKAVTIHTTANGYKYVVLTNNGSRKNLLLHRLVAQHFVPGKSAKNNKAIFKDHNKSNCKASNIKWGTHQEACKTGATGNHGNNRKGESNPRSKLTEADVIKIRRMKHNWSNVELAKRFNVTPVAIYWVRKNRSWTHVGIIKS